MYYYKTAEFGGMIRVTVRHNATTDLQKILFPMEDLLNSEDKLGQVFFDTYTRIGVHPISTTFQSIGSHLNLSVTVKQWMDTIGTSPVFLKGEWV